MGDGIHKEPWHGHEERIAALEREIRELVKCLRRESALSIGYEQIVFAAKSPTPDRAEAE